MLKSPRIQAAVPAVAKPYGFFKRLVNFALCFFAGASAFALGESVLKFGGREGWEQFSRRDGVAELEQISQYKTLALNSAAPNQDAALDMALSFDQDGAFTDSAGHYTLQVPDTVYKAGSSQARFGSGAAIFSGALSAAAYKNQADAGAIIMRARGNEALFSAGRNVGDFSIEFWLHPVSVENGEEPFSWTAAASGAYRVQNLSCSVSRNRMEWDFENFFFESAVQSDTPAKSVTVRL
ncbi:MAG: hypothetical protein LBJ35_01525, partial [Spirochaetaceae bacterium]|nr:hypothetical protein [Spirochaetaceae bacterium]